MMGFLLGALVSYTGDSIRDGSGELVWDETIGHEFSASILLRNKIGRIHL
jgi:hypothetical protein